jgi:hypothetical protein|tara:strand:+ start:34 stop:171 length:138 start_codon:yes stop_codon:yes gene_type:complete
MILFEVNKISDEINDGFFLLIDKYLTIEELYPKDEKTEKRVIKVR